MRSLAVGRSPTEARFTTAGVTAGGPSWEASLGFCEPWPYSWGLLGQESFFRYFTVTFRAVDFEFEVTPVTREFFK